MPEDMPDRMPDRMPEDMSEYTPEDMPDRMPDRMPEDMSDRMPEDMPVRKCINVMVGITRSKVIFLMIFWRFICFPAFPWHFLIVAIYFFAALFSFIRVTTPYFGDLFFIL